MTPTYLSPEVQKGWSDLRSGSPEAYAVFKVSNRSKPKFVDYDPASKIVLKCPMCSKSMLKSQLYRHVAMSHFMEQIYADHHSLFKINKGKCHLCHNYKCSSWNAFATHVACTHHLVLNFMDEKLCQKMLELQSGRDKRGRRSAVVAQIKSKMQK